LAPRQAVLDHRFDNAFAKIGGVGFRKRPAEWASCSVPQPPQRRLRRSVGRSGAGRCMGAVTTGTVKCNVAIEQRVSAIINPGMAARKFSSTSPRSSKRACNPHNLPAFCAKLVEEFARPRSAGSS
jgi:hypothetical protein